MRTAGFTGTVLASTCTKFLTTSQGSNVAMFSDVWLPAMASYASSQIQKKLKIAQSFINKYQTSSAQGYYTYAVFSAFTTFAEAMTKLKAQPTAASIKSSLLKIKDFQTFLGGVDSCNRTVWPDSSSCGDSLLVAVSNSGGQLKPIGGKMVQVKSSLLPK